jgi:hypothetical protein
LRLTSGGQRFDFWPENDGFGIALPFSISGVKMKRIGCRTRVPDALEKQEHYFFCRWSIPLENHSWFLISLADGFARQLAHADDVGRRLADAPGLLDAGEPQLDGDASRWLGRVGSALAFDSDPFRVGHLLADMQEHWFGETDAAVGVRQLTLDEKLALFESARLARCSLAHVDEMCANHFVSWVREKHDATVVQFARALSFLQLPAVGYTAAEAEAFLISIRKENQEAATAAAAAAAAPVLKRRRRGRSPR